MFGNRYSTFGESKFRLGSPHEDSEPEPAPPPPTPNPQPSNYPRFCLLNKDTNYPLNKDIYSPIMYKCLRMINSVHIGEEVLI